MSKKQPSDQKNTSDNKLNELFEEFEEINYNPEEFIFGPPPDLSEVSALDQELSLLKRNDSGNAQRLFRRYGYDLTYVLKSGWYGWSGKCWSLDDGPHMAQVAGQRTAHCLANEFKSVHAIGQFASETTKQFEDRLRSWLRFALNSGNSNKIAAMIREAEPYLASSIDDLDTHPLLFNVQNGTLDLDAEDNGEEEFDGIVLLPHSQEHLITKVAGVKYDRNAEAWHFRQFMEDILPDDEIREFVQRWLGYCLTGSPKEQVIVMFYGIGSNGKSVLMNVMHRVFGSYALALPFASLLHDDRKRGSEANPDLARLPGARFVTAAEPDIGAKFSESVLKQLTGGDKMIVRHLRQNFFEFKPQFKLCLSFNNKPAIRGQDEGIWRRILLVPFDQRYVEAHELERHPGAKLKDKDLEQKLWAEAPGILNWLLDGYRMWKESGLQIPAKVRAATEEYRQESNPVGEFIRTFCDRIPGSSIQAARLYEAYKLWSIENAMEPISMTRFGYRIKDLRIEKEEGRLVHYKGLSLNADGEAILRAAEDRKRPKRDEE